MEGQSEVRPYYMALRSYIITKDYQNKKGGLTRWVTCELSVDMVILAPIAAILIPLVYMI